MSDQPRSNLEKIKNLLLRRHKEVEKEIRQLEKEDPILSDGVAESSEPGTDSFRADVHNRLQALRNSLSKTSRDIQKSLGKIRQGTYGKCERCSKPIEAARMLVMPTASLCMSCSRKTSR